MCYYWLDRDALENSLTVNMRQVYVVEVEAVGYFMSVNFVGYIQLPCYIHLPPLGYMSVVQKSRWCSFLFCIQLCYNSVTIFGFHILILRCGIFIKNGHIPHDISLLRDPGNLKIYLNLLHNIYDLNLCVAWTTLYTP